MISCLLICARQFIFSFLCLFKYADFFLFINALWQLLSWPIARHLKVAKRDAFGSNAARYQWSTIGFPSGLLDATFGRFGRISISCNWPIPHFVGLRRYINTLAPLVPLNLILQMLLLWLVIIILARFERHVGLEGWLWRRAYCFENVIGHPREIIIIFHGHFLFLLLILRISTQLWMLVYLAELTEYIDIVVRTVHFLLRHDGKLRSERSDILNVCLEEAANFLTWSGRVKTGVLRFEVAEEALELGWGRCTLSVRS